MNNISENDTVNVNILLTDHLLPIPRDAVIKKHFGTRLIGKEQASHAVLSMKANVFVSWIGDKKFWLFNKNNGSFDEMCLRSKK